MGFDIIVQPWFPQYGIECQDIENENEIQKQNYEIHLRLDFTQFRIYFQDILIKKGIYMITAIDLFFFRRTMGVCLDGRVWGDGQLPMGGYQYVRWSLFYDNQYHDINMSGSHDYVIISDIFFKYHDINMSGGHNFVI